MIVNFKHKQNNNHSLVNTHTRSEYFRFFKTKYLRLLQAAFNKHEKRVSYYDNEILKDIIVPYQQFATQKLPNVTPIKSRHIWMLWQQGWDNAPPLVKACAQSWIDKNKGWEVHLVDEKSIVNFAPNYKNILAPKASRTAKANIARLSLLQEHGGVWADATLFCQQPLDDWLPKVMGVDFFTFSYPRPYRHCDIWFLASNPKTHLISSWLEMVADYWQHFKRPHHYYWMEYLFEFLIENDPLVKETWEQMPKLSALGPHLVQALAFENNPPPFALSAIKENIIPVQKLTHKWRHKGSLNNTPVGWLTGLEKLNDR